MTLFVQSCCCYFYFRCWDRLLLESLDSFQRSMLSTHADSEHMVWCSKTVSEIRRRPGQHPQCRGPKLYHLSVGIRYVTTTNRILHFIEHYKNNDALLGPSFSWLIQNKNYPRLPKIITVICHKIIKPVCSFVLEVLWKDTNKYIT